MPSGAKKRKAAKKKKVNNLTSTNPHQGENDGGELLSPASQDNQNAQDPTVDVTDKSNSNSEPEPEPTPIESLPVTEPIPETVTDKSVDVEIPPIADETNNEETKELIPPVESVPETVPDTVEDVEVPPIVEPVELVDPSLQVSKVYDETKNEEREELVVPETPEVVEENIIVREVALKDDLPTSSVDDSVAISTGVVEPVSTPPVHATDETHTIHHSDRQAPPTLEEQKTNFWTNCCGILELISGSGR